MGYSSWARKEVDTTERTYTHPFYCIEGISPFHWFCHINLLVNSNPYFPCHLLSSLSLSILFPLNHLFISLRLHWVFSASLVAARGLLTAVGSHH